jgi:3-hydroxymyristoyl/3-hydroxydecanoyl-(acyl carrier protein) dehydratase
MKVLRSRATMAKVSGTATVDGAVVAEAEILCVLADRQ